MAPGLCVQGLRSPCTLVLGMGLQAPSASCVAPAPARLFASGLRRPRGARGLVCRAAEITGKNVVVTGANRGIGLEFVRQFLDKGNKKVIATARSLPEATELNKLAEASGGRLVVMELDISSEESIKKWAHRLAAELDDEHVDVLVNNAGIYGARASFEHVTKQSLMEVFETNAVGPFLVAQALVNASLLGSPGSVVGNVTSKVGSVADNGSGGGYAYRSSKSALNIINKSMSIDLGERGITCVLLHPGWVKTDMTNHQGLITTDVSAGGLIEVLEMPPDKINGAWFDYKHEAIPW